MRALMLDDEAEAAELVSVYGLPLEHQGGHSVAFVNKVRPCLNAYGGQAAFN